MSPVVFDTPEAASYVKLAAVTMERYRLTGEGPKFLRLGKKAIRYRVVDLDEWLASRLVASTSQEIA
jgi:predicted DNA-binding transcriptional regulator AlpA